MDVKEAVEFINWLFSEQGSASLSHTHAYLFKYMWQGKTYKEIYLLDRKISERTLRNYGSKLCQRLNKELGIEANKATLKEEVETLFFLRKQEFRAHQEAQRNRSKDSSAIYLPTKGTERNDYKYANNLIEAARDTQTHEQMSFFIQALKVYKNYMDGDTVAALLCTTEKTSSYFRETLGTKAYRLGFARDLNYLISWLVQDYGISELAGSSDIARLYNIGGDAIWMSSNEASKAISLHELAFKTAHKDSSVKHLIVSSVFNKALCYIDSREL